MLADRASNVICIGSRVGGANVSNSCYIGSFFGQTALEGAAVFVNSYGKLVTNNSSQRFKEEIKPMDQIAVLTATMKEQTAQIQKIRAQLGLVINRFSGNSRSD